MFKCSTGSNRSTTNAVLENNICYNVVPFPDHLPTNESTTDASHAFQNPQSQPQAVIGVNLHPNVAYLRNSNRTGADAELNGTSGDYEYVYTEIDQN